MRVGRKPTSHSANSMKVVGRSTLEVDSYSSRVARPGDGGRGAESEAPRVRPV